jgi:hypothetical protein
MKGNARCGLLGVTNSQLKSSTRLVTSGRSYPGCASIHAATVFMESARLDLLQGAFHALNKIANNSKSSATSAYSNSSAPAPTARVGCYDASSVTSVYKSKEPLHWTVFPFSGSLFSMNLSAGLSPAPGPGFSPSGSLSFWAAGCCRSGAGSSANKPNPGPPLPAASTPLTLPNRNASSGLRYSPAAPGPTMPSLRTPTLSRAIRFPQNTNKVLVPKQKRRSSFGASRAGPFRCNTIQTIPLAPSCSRPPSKLFSATGHLCPILALPALGKSPCQTG